MKALTRLSILIAFSALIVACGQANPGPTAVVTSAPTETPIAFPTAQAATTLSPTPTATQTPTPTPELKQLTSDGCCVMPSWSPDSKQVLFIDKPSADEPSGVYAVDISQGTARPPQIVGRVGIYSPDQTLAAFAEGSETVVERLGTGESWVIPNQGHAVEFAPDDRHIAWEVEAISGPYDERRTDVYLANVDGKDSATVTHVYGGGLIGWMPNGLSLMFYGRPSLETHDRTLTILDLRTNIAADLVTVERLSGIAVSNGGTWVAYFISFDPDPRRNGIWLQRADGSEAKRIEGWGAYQWRDDSHLIVIPMRPSADRPFEIDEIDAGTGSLRHLTDANVTPLSILNGDWRVSPDGNYIVFVNSVDRNLWLLKLP